MPSRILLINYNQCDAPYPVFPLGLACIDTVLRHAGHHTRWLDLYADGEPVAQVVQEFRPDFIGISLRNIDDVLIKNRETYFDGLAGLCRELKRLEPAPIILGGSGFSIFPERLLDLTEADFGIQGEGEESLVALLNALESAGDWSHIPGLVYRSRGRVLLNPRRRSIPATKLMAPERLEPLAELYLQRSSMLNVQTQRGCAFRCCYCTYPLIEGRSYRRRPGEVVAEELERLRQQGVQYVFFVDSVFNSSPAHVADVCEAMLRRKVDMKWGCFLRPKGLTPDLMRLMAQSGLSDIEFGTDSFCDSVLESYGKRFTFEDIWQASELASSENVAYCHFLILGGPGETRETLRVTYENSLRLHGAVILALVGMRIYPGTPLYTQMRGEGRIARDTDLLQPRYYLSPRLSQEEVFEQLRGFARQSPNWIAGDFSPEYRKMIERLRARGVVGPLWKYVPALRSLFPEPSTVYPGKLA